MLVVRLRVTVAKRWASGIFAVITESVPEFSSGTPEEICIGLIWVGLVSVEVCNMGMLGLNKKSSFFAVVT